MKVKAYGKINLSLDIIGKDAKGYHLLQMVMQNIDLHDNLEINKIHKGISIHGSGNVPLNSQNLAFKAAEVFIDRYHLNFGVDIKIEKNIPVAAGLAGGSSDAAAVLKAMSELAELQIPQEEMLNMGLSIGADVPYCIKGGTALCEGIGEKITVLPHFNDKLLVLVKPDFGLSTKDVYGKFDNMTNDEHVNTNMVIESIKRNDIFELCKHMKNVLEIPSFTMKPVLCDIKKQMLSFGAINAMMSGSGPTIFGIFNDEVSANNCADHFTKTYKEVFITRTI